VRLREKLRQILLIPEGGNPVIKWEYKIINVEKAFYSNNADEIIEKSLNDLGQEGWELVGYVTFKAYMIVFKRPIH
jgi:hypothetical protein